VIERHASPRDLLRPVPRNPSRFKGESMRPSFYRSFEEFEREELRPGNRIGFSLDDLIEETAFDGELEFDSEEEE
jgi:hypothetical protein